MESIEPILRGGIRGIVSLLIATLFLLILMVASAQQEAINALQRADSKISYSVAHKIMADAVQAERERAPFETENRNLRAENRRLKQEGDKPDAELIEKWGTVTGIGQRIARAGTCELGDANPEFNALWTAIETCVADGRTSPAIAREVQALQASESNPRVLLRRLNELSRRVKLNDEAILDNDKRITELQAKITAAETARNSLQDVATLESLGVVRWLSLTRIPPALMGILMCFSAGLFGALLITLILTVYPKSDLGFTTSNSYWSRILLGGLIAVGMFVVIGGGVAVVGTGQTLLSGSPNFMSFCAIGLLAGMFSDRVARWLSERAKVFVDDAAGAKPAPEPKAEEG